MRVIAVVTYVEVSVTYTVLFPANMTVVSLVAVAAFILACAAATVDLMSKALTDLFLPIPRRGYKKNSYKMRQRREEVIRGEKRLYEEKRLYTRSRGYNRREEVILEEKRLY